MASLSLITPKSLLVKIADMFQGPIDHPGIASPEVKSEDKPSGAINKKLTVSKSKPSRLSISLDDLKIISTALLHYRRSLTKMGEQDRAEGIARIDQRFYEMIMALETQEMTADQAA